MYNKIDFFYKDVNNITTSVLKWKSNILRQRTVDAFNAIRD